MGSIFDPFSRTFGDGNIIPVQYSEYVSTTVFNYGIANSSTLTTVGGYPLSGIELACEKWGNVYEVRIDFSNDSKEQYDDLVNKLTVLYGTPYNYTETRKDFICKKQKEYEYYVWIGANSTAVFIMYGTYESTITKLEEPYIVLTYGSMSYTSRFLDEEIRNKKSIEEKNRLEVERIKNDNTRL